MNTRIFFRALGYSGGASALLVAYLVDTNTAYQQRVTLVIAILLLLMCLLIALYCALDKRVLQPSRMTADQRANAALFRHYPQTASFQVRSRSRAPQTQARFYKG
jgi:hypothetical protein